MTTSTSTSVVGAQSSKILDRGLISQSKIRQTQMFINDSLEYANSEYMLSRRLNSNNGDEHHNANHTAFTRSKSLRLNKTPIKLNTNHRL